MEQQKKNKQQQNNENVVFNTKYVYERRMSKFEVAHFVVLCCMPTPAFCSSHPFYWFSLTFQLCVACCILTSSCYVLRYGSLHYIFIPTNLFVSCYFIYFIVGCSSCRRHLKPKTYHNPITLNIIITFSLVLLFSLVSPKRINNKNCHRDYVQYLSFVCVLVSVIIV